MQLGSLTTRARFFTRFSVSAMLAVSVVFGSTAAAQAQVAPPALPALPELPNFAELSGQQTLPDPDQLLNDVPLPPGVQLPEIPGVNLPGQESAPAQQGDVMLTNVPSRTSFAAIKPWGIVQTPNANESRPGLSIVKLYLADYVLRHGDHSERERELSERMIRLSDDNAATILDKKYPDGINAVAREYGLGNTWRGSRWGLSYTSALDTARYLDKVSKSRPDSLILRWMRTAAPEAADGTRQNWGTSHLPGVTGSKWGWSDYGDQTVASASIGSNYTAAAFTFGGPAAQNADVERASEHLQ